MYFLIPVVFYLLFVLGVLALCMAAAKKPLPRGITVKAAIGSQCPAVLEESASSRTQRTPAAKGSTPFAPALSPNVSNLTEEVNAPLRG